MTVIHTLSYPVKKHLMDNHAIGIEKYSGTETVLPIIHNRLLNSILEKSNEDIYGGLVEHHFSIQESNNQVERETSEYLYNLHKTALALRGCHV